MTTLTIEKGPQTGTGERRGPSAEKPADLYPASKKLRKALGAYQAAALELEECRGRASKADADIAMLGDSTLSEAESLEAISSAHVRKELYQSRIAAFERKAAVLLQELRSAMIPAYNEVRGLVIGEVERRVAVLEGRVSEACGGFVEHSVIARGILIRLCHQSKLVWAIERMTPAQLIGLGSMAGEATVAEAQSLLATLEQISARIGEDI